MKASKLADYIKVSTETVEHFLELEPEELFKNEEYLDLLRGLNRAILAETLPEARAAYEAGLPELKKRLAEKGINSAPMSPNTLGNWLVSAVSDQKTAELIIEKHKNITGDIIRYGLEDILHMVSTIQEGSREWQKALCVLSIPLMKRKLEL